MQLCGVILDIIASMTAYQQMMVVFVLIILGRLFHCDFGWEVRKTTITVSTYNSAPCKFYYWYKSDD